MRLIDHLKSLGLGNRAARDHLESGKIWLRGVPVADAAREVDPADVRVRPDAPRVRMGRDPVVIWRDDDIAVLFKPSGLLSVPAPGREDEPNVLAEIGRRFGSVYAVHRLDEETSGLMLLAFRPESQQALKSLIEDHEVERRYLALVLGDFKRDGTHASVLLRDRGDGRRGSAPGREWHGAWTESPPALPIPAGGGKLAVTRVRRVEGCGRACLVEAWLETGRTHQVRIHLAELGHPVLGDGLYGPVHTRRDRRGGRLALHAWRLAFTHPFTRAPLSFEAPLADDLEQRRRELRGETPRRDQA